MLQRNSLDIVNELGIIKYLADSQRYFFEQPYWEVFQLKNIVPGRMGIQLRTTGKAGGYEGHN